MQNLTFVSVVLVFSVSINIISTSTKKYFPMCGQRNKKPDLSDVCPYFVNALNFYLFVCVCSWNHIPLG